MRVRRRRTPCRSGETWTWTSSTPWKRFVDRVVGVQQGLFAYILTLVPHVARRQRRAPGDEPDPVAEAGGVSAEAAFWPWARTIAHYQVLAHLKRHSRDRLRFGEGLMSRLAEEAVAHEAPSVDVEQAALGRCVEELPPPKRELIELRYSSGLADRGDRPPHRPVARRDGRCVVPHPRPTGRVHPGQTAQRERQDK